MKQNAHTVLVDGYTGAESPPWDVMWGKEMFYVRLPPHGMRYEWAEQLFGVWWPDVDWGDQSSGSEAQTDARNTSVTRTSFEIYTSIQNMIVIMTNIFFTLIRWNNGRLFICFLNACYRSYCEQFVITYIWFIYSFDLYWNVSFIEILL